MQSCSAVDSFDRSKSLLGRRAWIFAAVVAFVGVVSLYDGYLIIRTGDLILQFEKNPIGLYLIKFNHGDPSLFLRLKAAGTVLVVTGLSLLKRQSPRLADPVAWAVVLFQAALLVYLEYPA